MKIDKWFRGQATAVAMIVGATAAFVDRLAELTRGFVFFSAAVVSAFVWFLIRTSLKQFIVEMKRYERSDDDFREEEAKDHPDSEKLERERNRRALALSYAAKGAIGAIFGSMLILAIILFLLPMAHDIAKSFDQ